MKKLLAVILSLLLIFSLTACQKGENIDSDMGDVLSETDIDTSVEEENDSDNEKEDTSSGSAQSGSTANKKQSSSGSSSKGSTSASNKGGTSASNKSGTSASNKGGTTNNNNTNNNKTSQNNNTQINTQTPTEDNEVIEKIDNGVLEKASSQDIKVPENIKLMGTDSATQENNENKITVTAGLYQLDGGVVNWTSENDLIYIITSNNNRLVVIDSKTMMPISNVALAGKPAEMNLIGDKIYISLPDLRRIDIFSKSDYTKVSSLYFEHEISSFCIDGNYIYYSEHDQHCDVFRMNVSTSELTKILPDRGWSFYQPKLYLNKEDNILYIGETGSTGSTLYYYNATTLELKSFLRKNDYGIMNHTRDIFHIGNDVFWGCYRLSDTDANRIIGSYGSTDYGCMNFASAELVSTFDGIFLTDTYECIVDYFDAGLRFRYMLVTKSGNVFFRERGFDVNEIVGVNFSIQ